MPKNIKELNYLNFLINMQNHKKLIMKKLLFLVLVPVISLAMDAPKEAREIARNIVRLKKRKAIEEEEKRVLTFLKLPPQPEHMDSTMFFVIALACTPEDIPLMDQLIAKKTITANAHTKVYGRCCTLLGVSIYHAVNNGYDLKMVELLLQKGANVDQETMEHGKSTYVEDYTTPLEFATSKQDRQGDPQIPLIKLLLQHKADPNRKSRDRTPFMNLVQKYVNRYEKDQPPIYELIKECLEKYGASVDVESKALYSRFVGTPFQYVKEKQATQLINLFEEHQRQNK